MPEWMIHLVDGETLTDDDCYPHEVDSDRITSVERIISGRTLTIKKSPLIEDFFIGTEASADFIMMGAGAGTTANREILKKILGCHIKNSDPPIQCQFSMDPRNFNTILELFEVHRKTPRGINARRVVRVKKLRELYQRQFVDETHGIFKTAIIKRVFQTPTGLCCELVKPKVKAEVFVRGSNILLEFGRHGENLSPE